MLRLSLWVRGSTAQGYISVSDGGGGERRWKEMCQSCEHYDCMLDSHTIFYFAADKLKSQIEKYRIARGLQGTSADSATSGLDEKEEQLKRELEAEKERYIICVWVWLVRCAHGTVNLLQFS